MLTTILLILTTLLTDTAHTEAFVSGTYGRSTHAILGESNGGFGVHARSVYDINTTHRVFGEASYDWNKSRANHWGENADYELLYPYLTCDTIGGGLKTETYSFYGGYRMLKRNIVWHIALRFRAMQSYRDVDPRPKNKVTDLNVDGGIGYLHNNYAYYLQLNVGRYKQNNDIKFYSELGESMIYHLVTPSADYVRFAGSQKESYYHGFRAGAAFHVLPAGEGWMAAVQYNLLRVTKELHDNTYIPIGRLTNHALSAQLGYHAPLWNASLSGGFNMRRAMQYIYGAAVNNYYNLLDKRITYAGNSWHIGIDASYTLPLPFGKLTFVPALQYIHILRGDAATSTRFDELGDLLTDNRLNASASICYFFPIHRKINWFVRPVGGCTYYTTTTRHTWQVAVETGIAF